MDRRTALKIAGAALVSPSVMTGTPMLDDKGKRVTFEAIETTSQTVTSVGAYLFDLSKDPKNCVTSICKYEEL